MNVLSLLAVGAAIAPSSAQVPTSSPDKATALLHRVVDRYAAMKSIKGAFTITQKVAGNPPVNIGGKFRAQRPKRYTIDLTGPLSARFVCNGRSVLMFYETVPAYSLAPADDEAINQTVTAVPPLTLFFNQHKLLAPSTPTRYLGPDTFDGAACEVVEQTLGPTMIRYTIDPRYLVVRIQVHLKQGNQVADVDSSVSGVEVDTPMELTDFLVEPPKGAREIPAPTLGGKPIAKGQAAPAFILPAPNSGSVDLAIELKRHKAVLVTFWFYDCATCREEFPELMKLYRRLRSRGMGMIAVNSFDDRHTVSKYVRDGGLMCPVALDDDSNTHHGIAKRYGIALYPTSYLIGPDGKVLERFVGFKKAELVAALTKAGIADGKQK